MDPLQAHRKNYLRCLQKRLKHQQIILDEEKLIALGSDASFYLLKPWCVLVPETMEEVSDILGISTEYRIPVTFRAAGTSLSGQSVTDSVLIWLGQGWTRHEVLDQGNQLRMGPGLIGAEANRILKPYHRKIGPDPASIDHCKIGGIAANNASGMCCGVDQNCYQTVEAMKIVFHDGTILDTQDEHSRDHFRNSHPKWIRELENIRDEIMSDPALRDRIRHKYRIKNTLGYGMNAFVDYTDPLDILSHLVIGSEGTLAFIAEITLRSVEVARFKCSSMIFFENVEKACQIIRWLKAGNLVQAAELMDFASMKAVEDRMIRSSGHCQLDRPSCALLIEVGAHSSPELEDKKKQIQSWIPDVGFTVSLNQEQDLWKMRKGLFPSVGAVRKPGTTVIIEDFVVSLDRLSEAFGDIQDLTRLKGYEDAILFGHALEGNMHLVFSQDFSIDAEIKRYQELMDGISRLIVRKYDGSLKGEHGTGRNMAPFVELEWGTRITDFMKRIKNTLDPHRVLNPGVILNDDPEIHLKNLKPCPGVHTLIDRCMECGFCELHCPSRKITFTPRQRIVFERQRMWMGVPLTGRAREYVEKSCATDGLCSLDCPVEINTGDYIKVLRSRRTNDAAQAMACWIASHFRFVSDFAGVIAGFAGRVLSPLFPYLPIGRGMMDRDLKVTLSDEKAVYFPSCLTRSFGPSGMDQDQRSLRTVTLNILRKAKVEVIDPADLKKLCCGLSFESKGFPDQAEFKLRELEEALWVASEQGKVPIVFDTSPCALRVKRAIQKPIRIFESCEYVHEVLMHKLRWKRTPEPIALHVTCSMKRMGLDHVMKDLAEKISEKVVIPESIGCCGFAGDKGWSYPKLNRSALSGLREELPVDCRRGFSNSRMCEVGLSRESGIGYQHILYLIDQNTL